jgi:hypothetical protein
MASGAEGLRAAPEGSPGRLTWEGRGFVRHAKELDFVSRRDFLESRAPALAGEQNYFVLGRRIHRRDRTSVLGCTGPGPHITRGHLEPASDLSKVLFRSAGFDSIAEKQLSRQRERQLVRREGRGQHLLKTSQVSRQIATSPVGTA